MTSRWKRPLHDEATSGGATAWERMLLALVAALALVCYAHIYATRLADAPARSDGFSYYVYLPSWVKYHDTTLELESYACCRGTYPDWSGLRRWEGTNRWVNPHPIGVAVLALPFFAVAHAVNSLTRMPMVPYEHAAGVAGVFYLLAGLFVLGRLLRRHFSPGVAMATLLIVTFGTNLFHYATYDSLWSHVYSFFLIACLLYLVDVSSRVLSWRRAGLLGAVVGLIFLVRHASLPVVVFVPLFGVVGWRSLVERARFLVAHRWQLAVAALVALLVAMPQLLMYRQATGSMVIDPYSRLMQLSGIVPWHFYTPQFARILWLLPKGVFVWSPVLVLGVAGVFLLRERARAFLLPSVVFLGMNTYLIASWFDWQFGGGFGHRGFTESFAVLAIPMAAAWQRLLRHRRLAVVVGILTVLAVVLSLIQMWQYWHHVLPYSDTTWAQYRSAVESFFSGR